MITLISATHRPHSNTLKVARAYLQAAEAKGIDMQLFSLEELPHDFVFTDHFGERTESFGKLVEKYILPVQKLVIIVPEYSGSFPGILKAFIDSLPHEMLEGKKIALVGVATGRGGNMRGMDHLVGIFHYLRSDVYFDKIPVSQVHHQLDDEGQLTDPYTLSMFGNQLDGFVKY